MPVQAGCWVRLHGTEATTEAHAAQAEAAPCCALLCPGFSVLLGLQRFSLSLGAVVLCIVVGIGIASVEPAEDEATVAVALAAATAQELTPP